MLYTWGPHEVSAPTEHHHSVLPSYRWDNVIPIHQSQTIIPLTNYKSPLLMSTKQVRTCLPQVMLVLAKLLGPI